MAGADQRYDVGIGEVLERLATDRPDLEQHHGIAPHIARHTVLLIEQSLPAEEREISFPAP